MWIAGSRGMDGGAGDYNPAGCRGQETVQRLDAAPSIEATDTTV